MGHGDPPELTRYAPGERRLIRRLSSPARVQRWLDSIPYNWERRAPSLRTFRGVVRRRRAQCLEGALAAAAILEQHGHPPLLLDIESRDRLDHVVLLYRRRGRFGTVGVSREPALEGRKPVYRNVHTLVRSYAAPYIDGKACIVRYKVFDLRRLRRQDWRASLRNVWHVERALIRRRGRPFRVSRRFEERWRRRYLSYKRAHPRREPTFYPSRRHWL